MVLSRKGPVSNPGGTGEAMAAYLLVQVTIADEARWAAYRDAVGPLIARFGGKRASEAAGVELLEGRDDGRRVVMFEFPSMDAVRAFWNAPEYQPVKALRRGAAALEAWAVPGP